MFLYFTDYYNTIHWLAAPANSPSSLFKGHSDPASTSESRDNNWSILWAMISIPREQNIPTLQLSVILQSQPRHSPYSRGP